MNKYIIARDDSSYRKSFPGASDLCQNDWNTTLASIHSDDDLSEVRYLCRTINQNCWIGLSNLNGDQKTVPHLIMEMIYLDLLHHGMEVIHKAKETVLQFQEE